MLVLLNIDSSEVPKPKSTNRETSIKNLFGLINGTIKGFCGEIIVAKFAASFVLDAGIWS